MDEDFMYQLEGRYLDAAEAVKLKVHLNMAAAQIKTGDFNTAIYNCGQVGAMSYIGFLKDAVQAARTVRSAQS